MMQSFEVALWFAVTGLAGFAGGMAYGQYRLRKTCRLCRAVL